MQADHEPTTNVAPFPTTRTKAYRSKSWWHRPLPENVTRLRKRSKPKPHYVLPAEWLAIIQPIVASMKRPQLVRFVELTAAKVQEQPDEPFASAMFHLAAEEINRRDRRKS